MNLLRTSRTPVIAVVRAFIVLVLLLGIAGQSLPSRAQDEPQPPAVNAENIVILSDFNEVVYEQDAHVRVPPASLTKMMTAIVAMRYSTLDTPVTVDAHDLVGEATMGLVEGDQLTLGDVLYGLLLPSGNDAAMAIARTVGWQEGDVSPDQSVERFVGLMNQTARELQLWDTHFANPHGLDAEGHYSSAYDLAIILRTALNYPEIRERMQTIAVRVGDQYDLYNGNQLLRERSDILGGKTGLTDGAGFCLAVAARQDGRMVIVVALRNDWSWFWDMDLLLDYGFQLVKARGIPAWADPSLVGTQLLQPHPGSN